jgi:hypothetical protein
MQFDGYHEQFNDFKPLFLAEIKKQNLMADLKGNCFNVYFSEKDWAIGCRIQNKTDVRFPLTIEYCKNKKYIKFPYDGPAKKIPQFLEFASIHITNNNFYWDGPLIIDNVNNITLIMTVESVITERIIEYIEQHSRMNSMFFVLLM